MLKKGLVNYVTNTIMVLNIRFCVVQVSKRCKRRSMLEHYQNQETLFEIYNRHEKTQYTLKSCTSLNI